MIYHEAKENHNFRPEIRSKPETSNGNIANFIQRNFGATSLTIREILTEPNSAAMLQVQAHQAQALHMTATVTLVKAKGLRVRLINRPHELLCPATDRDLPRLSH